jgi:hypothetical protein
VNVQAMPPALDIVPLLRRRSACRPMTRRSTPPTQLDGRDSMGGGARARYRVPSKAGDLPHPPPVAALSTRVAQTGSLRHNVKQDSDSQGLARVQDGSMRPDDRQTTRASAGSSKVDGDRKRGTGALSTGCWTGLSGRPAFANDRSRLPLLLVADSAMAW